MDGWGPKRLLKVKSPLNPKGEKRKAFGETYFESDRRRLKKHYSHFLHFTKFMRNHSARHQGLPGIFETTNTVKGNKKCLSTREKKKQNLVKPVLYECLVYRPSMCDTVNGPIFNTWVTPFSDSFSSALLRE